MATVTLGGNAVKVEGNFPQVGATAPAFTLVKNDLSEFSLQDVKGKKVVLNIFPSLDTAVCATSVRKFNELAAKMDNTVVLAISKDLPFAQARFCTTEDIENVEVLSAFRNTSARAVVVLDETGKVVYSELVPEITTEPNYDQALKAL